MKQIFIKPERGHSIFNFKGTFYIQDYNFLLDKIKNTLVKSIKLGSGVYGCKPKNYTSTQSIGSCRENFGLFNLENGNRKEVKFTVLIAGIFCRPHIGRKKKILVKRGEMNEKEVTNFKRGWSGRATCGEHMSC